MNINNVVQQELQIGKEKVILETGILAKKASAAVSLKCSDTYLLVTACVSDEPRAGINFFPLLVDYDEKMYSVGKIPGGFLRKEGRPTDKATLACRLIDRPIRPLFPTGYRNDVQIVASVMSSDQKIQPDVLAIVGASAALYLSSAPFYKPVGAARVGKIDNNYIINPTYEEINNSDLDIIVAGTEDSVLMVEAGAYFVSEEEVLDAIRFAMEEIKKQVAAIKEFGQKCNVVKEEYTLDIDLSPIASFIKENYYTDIENAYRLTDSDARSKILKEIKKRLKESLEALEDNHPIKLITSKSDLDYVTEQFKEYEKEIMRRIILDEGTRADGRSVTEIRPISCQVGMLPRAHGSGLFTRGDTQVMSVVTLGPPGDKQMLDGIDPATERTYIHHYAFPGFSTGEVKPLRGPGRREIGHGYLAERALIPVLPQALDFGYTIRVNSDVISSNGSTSMASTCGSTLALMDAGVPISTPISGIAMGLIKEGDKVAILSDIQGLEDFLGDMDFKVTGGKEGITALQMDIKIDGISLDILRSALDQAKTGRHYILDKMLEVISEPKKELSPWAPKLISFTIDTSLIGEVIGPGGKTIKSIIEQTGVTIDIDDSGLVTITGQETEAVNKARDMIKTIATVIKPGDVYCGKVTRIIPIGAVIEIFKGKDGLLHISQISHQHVKKVEDFLSIGDEVVVKIREIDDRGRLNLSMKVVTDEERELVLSKE